MATQIWPVLLKDKLKFAGETCTVDPAAGASKVEKQTFHPWWDSGGIFLSCWWGCVVLQHSPHEELSKMSAWPVILKLS